LEYSSSIEQCRKAMRLADKPLNGAGGTAKRDLLTSR
jgi:hypothetical protein